MILFMIGFCSGMIVMCVFAVWLEARRKKKKEKDSYESDLKYLFKKEDKTGGAIDLKMGRFRN